jgi:hypothetical protein
MTVAAAASGYGKRHSMKFATKKVEGGTQVTRVE